MYTQGVHGGVYTGWYIPQGVPRVYLGRGIPLPICLPTIPRRVYPPYMPLLPYHPGYTTLPPCCPVYRSSCPVCSPLPDDRALGSNLRIRAGMRRIEPSFLLRCVVRKGTLRRVLSFLPEERMKDWIGQGSPSGKSPM